MFECIKCEWEFEESQLDDDSLCGSCSDFACFHNKLLWNCEPCTESRDEYLKWVAKEMGIE